MTRKHDATAYARSCVARYLALWGYQSNETTYNWVHGLAQTMPELVWC